MERDPQSPEPAPGQVPRGGVPLPLGVLGPAQSLAPGQESNVLGKALPTVDRPHPCSLQGGQPSLASWEINGAELGLGDKTLQQDARGARKPGFSHQLLSRGGGGEGASSQAKAEPWSC